MQLTVWSEKSAIWSEKHAISVQIFCPYPAYELYIIVDKYVTDISQAGLCFASVTVILIQMLSLREHTLD
jgi:hypothetical protein